MRSAIEKLTIGITVLLIAILTAFLVSVIRNRPRATRTTFVAPTADANDPSRGPETAAITIIEFGDFQCPFCKLAQTQFDATLIKYRDRVRHVWKDFPIASQHPEALNAAETAHCAHEQGKFWEMHDELFKRQSELSSSLYTELAQTLNLNVEAFQACMNDDRTLPAIEADSSQAERAGIDGVPTYIVNGKPLFELPDGKNLETLIEASL